MHGVSENTKTEGILNVLNIQPIKTPNFSPFFQIHPSPGHRDSGTLKRFEIPFTFAAYEKQEIKKRRA